MTILDAMETMRRVLEAQKGEKAVLGGAPREKAVAAYNAIAAALDISAHPCVERIVDGGGLSCRRNRQTGEHLT